MIYVGIDVAKNKHDCCILSNDGKQTLSSFSFKNHSEGYSKLYSQISRFEKDPSMVEVGMENTGHYSLNLARWLEEQGYKLTCFNPMQTNQFNRSQSLRRTKTDKADAKAIATVLYLGQVKPVKRSNAILEDLKFLTRHRHRLLQQKGTLTVSITRLLDIIFPELSKFVTNVHTNYVYDLLDAYPTTKDILEADLESLSSIVNKSSHGHHGLQYAIDIQALAKDSIGYSNEALAFELRQTIRLVRILEDEIDKLDDKIEDLMDELKSPITTIPGIGMTLGAIILAEIGDIENFPSAEKLQAFAGLDPTISQSGQYKASQSHMVKRGSSYLRYAIGYATRLAVTKDDYFKAFYQKKRDEGKPYGVAMGHCCKKMIRIMFHILKTGEKYNLKNSPE